MAAYRENFVISFVMLVQESPLYQVDAQKILNRIQSLQNSHVWYVCAVRREGYMQCLALYVCTQSCLYILHISSYSPRCTDREITKELKPPFCNICQTGRCSFPDARWIFPKLTTQWLMLHLLNVATIFVVVHLLFVCQTSMVSHRSINHPKINRRWGGTITERALSDTVR